MTIYNNITTVEYIIQENFIIQNEDIRLPVEFERFNVPYEYVEREVMLENHLIFMKEPNDKYINDTPYTRMDFLLTTLFNQGSSLPALDGTLYARLGIDNSSYLMRLAKLETKFTMMISGKFLDNYTAGVQRYEGDSPERMYTIPFSYTDSAGKFENFNQLAIGFSSFNAPLRLADNFRNPYDILGFPNANFNNKGTLLDVALINTNATFATKKDAREKISLTYTSYLENETEELKFF